MPVIYKFGGTSLKDVDSIKKVVKIIQENKDKKVVVVSAMGKTTKALELLVDDYLKRYDIDAHITKIVNFHQNIIRQLFEDEWNKVVNEFNRLVINLFAVFKKKRIGTDNFYYDKIIAYGELFSAFILSRYLKYIKYDAKLIDIRKVIKTDSSYRNAIVNWDITKELAQQTFTFSDTNLYITQGFIGSDENNNTTSLGLEGSDFSASILSYVLDAQKLIVWKDVNGIYSSDPHKFAEVAKLDVLSYKEAVELAYFGAKVIHPKTIKPLENKGIPLYVKSFLHPDESGTLITETTENKLGVEPYVPLFIIKDNQTLISISPRDFSFISESALAQIFSILNSNDIEVNLMQNSAISFSVCVDFRSKPILQAIKELRQKYKVRYNSGLSLVTIRHYNPEIIDKVIGNKEILVEQKSRNTARFVVGYK